MTVRYQTREGDTVDLVCWRHYGTRQGATEAVLEANPGLADLGPVLPAGKVIDLPDLAPAAISTKVISFWD